MEAVKIVSTKNNPDLVVGEYFEVIHEFCFGIEKIIPGVYVVFEKEVEEGEFCTTKIMMITGGFRHKPVVLKYSILFENDNMSKYIRKLKFKKFVSNPVGLDVFCDPKTLHCGAVPLNNFFRFVKTKSGYRFKPSMIFYPISVARNEDEDYCVHLLEVKTNTIYKVIIDEQDYSDFIVEFDNGTLCFDYLEKG